MISRDNRWEAYGSSGQCFGLCLLESGSGGLNWKTSPVPIEGAAFVKAREVFWLELGLRECVLGNELFFFMPGLIGINE